MSRSRLPGEDGKLSRRVTEFRNGYQDHRPDSATPVVKPPRNVILVRLEMVALKLHQEIEWWNFTSIEYVKE